MDFKMMFAITMFKPYILSLIYRYIYIYIHIYIYIFLSRGFPYRGNLLALFVSLLLKWEEE